MKLTGVMMFLKAGVEKEKSTYNTFILSHIDSSRRTYPFWNSWRRHIFSRFRPMPDRPFSLCSITTHFELWSFNSILNKSFSFLTGMFCNYGLGVKKNEEFATSRKSFSVKSSDFLWSTEQCEKIQLLLRPTLFFLSFVTSQPFIFIAPYIHR